MASQFPGSTLDPASPLGQHGTAPDRAGTLMLRSTDGVPLQQRLDYWRHSVLHRMDPIAPTVQRPDIAFRSGFIDMPTFNRMFRKRFGKTPSGARYDVMVAAATV